MNRSSIWPRWGVLAGIVVWTSMLLAQPDPQIRIQPVKISPVGDSLQVTLMVQVPFPENALPGILEDGKQLRYRLDFSVWNAKRELLLLKHFSRTIRFVPGRVDTVTVRLVLPPGRFYLTCYPMNLPIYIVPVRMQELDLIHREDAVSSQKISLDGNFCPFTKVNLYARYRMKNQRVV
ncbi:MAG: hypothetical protein GXO78_09230 [Calditrichaeota bacterium]|nr:hypothetical protein [Calditrichota bacterium]